MAPSQLSSMPLPQISAVAALGTQVAGLPALQAPTVTRQAPRPHETVPSTAGSSTVPLQSLSRPSQVSVEGSTSPMQGPSALSMHWAVPDLHAPVFIVPAGPL